MFFEQSRKKYLPVSKEEFYLDSKKRNGQIEILQHEIKRIKSDLEKLFTELNIIEEKIEQMSFLCNETAKKIIEGLDEIEAEFEELKGRTEQIGVLKENFLQTVETEQKIEEEQKKILNISRETVWAQIFNNSITESSWLKNKNFTPGRWAVGYQYLYILYRILDEVKPKNILDLGLGQTTHMITQYAEANPDVRHVIIEHDQKWMDFFETAHRLANNSKILKINIEMTRYKEAAEVRVFQGLKEKLKDTKFDLISIDAPLGGDMKIYARIDILDLLPDNINPDNYIILMDDADRPGERKTISEILIKMRKMRIGFCTGDYIGEKKCKVICSENNKFVCSM